MQSLDLYSILKASAEKIRVDNPEIQQLPDELQADALVSDYGFDVITFGDLERDLEERLDGRKINLESFLVPETFYDITIGEVFEYIRKKVSPPVVNPIVVYVDDEEENLFIFKRKFGKDFNLRTFTDPTKALEFIAQNADVQLVITDEVMPGLRGNELNDKVKQIRPFMKFILITGNPENDDDLMYASLRRNRFFEFIQKPVDFDGKRGEYLAMIKSAIE